MANNRRYLIHLPHFSEYLFRVITTIPRERKYNLTQQERIMLSTPDKVNKFCANEPFEKLLFIFTKLGFEWTLSLGPTEEIIQEGIDSCAYQYDSKMRRMDVVEALVREQLCTISSRDVMLLHQMCAQNCSTLAYQLTYVTQQLKAISGPSAKKPYDLQTKEAEDTVGKVSEIMLQQMCAIDYAEQRWGMGVRELKVLSALFIRRNSAITLKEIVKNTSQENKKLYIGKDILKMEKEGLVTVDKLKERKTKGFGLGVYFMITTKGIQRMLDFNNYVWEKVFGSRG